MSLKDTFNKAAVTTLTVLGMGTALAGVKMLADAQKPEDYLNATSMLATSLTLGLSAENLRLAKQNQDIKNGKTFKL